jgi:uncharacterized protein (TIGR02996 family)
MDLHDAFLRDIHRHPRDKGRRLIYADWLEEQGDPQSLARAALLRLEVECANLEEGDQQRSVLVKRIKEMRLSAGKDWLASLADVPIEACLRWQFRCPKQWEKLRLTDDAAVRFCASCRMKVHYCTSIDEAKEHARQGHCVAVDAGVERRPGDLAEAVLRTVTLGAMDFGEERMRGQRRRE